MIREFRDNNPKTWDLIKFILFISFVLLVTACENTYKPNKNYVYTFSCVIEKDDYGRKVYGAHHFVLDEQIKDMSSFEECYVNYLQWSGLDKDGMYKKSYYADRKNVNIYLVDEVWGNVTLESADLCNVN
jgi:hypothetical protein